MEKTKFNYVTRIENTPFSIVENEEGKAFIAIGNRIVTDGNNKEELMEMVEKKPWNFLVNVVCAVMDIKKEVEDDEGKA